MSDLLEQALEDALIQDTHHPVFRQMAKHKERPGKEFLFQEDDETNEEARLRAAALIAAI